MLEKNLYQYAAEILLGCREKKDFQFFQNFDQELEKKNHINFSLIFDNISSKVNANEEKLRRILYRLQSRSYHSFLRDHRIVIEAGSEEEKSLIKQYYIYLQHYLANFDFSQDYEEITPEDIDNHQKLSGLQLNLNNNSNSMPQAVKPIFNTKTPIDIVNISAKGPNTTSIISRAIMSNMVSIIDKKNLELKKTTNVQGAILERITRLFVEANKHIKNYQPNPVQVNHAYVKAVHFLKTNPSIVVTFPGNIFTKGIKYFKLLNAHATGKNSDDYRELRSAMEMAMYGNNLNPEQKAFFENTFESRPTFSAAQIMTKNQSIRPITNYGNLFAIADDSQKYNGIFTYFQALDYFSKHGSAPPSCTYPNIDLLLYQCDANKFKAIIYRAIKGDFEDNFSQQYNGDPGYIEAHFSSFIQIRFLYIDPKDYQLTKEDKENFKKMGITVYNTPENPLLPHILPSRAMELVRAEENEENIKALDELLTSLPILTKITNPGGKSLLQLATEQVSKGYIRVLVKHNADILAIDKNGLYPLRIAYEYKSLEMLKLLLPNHLVRRKYEILFQDEKLRKHIADGEILLHIFEGVTDEYAVYLLKDAKILDIVLAQGITSDEINDYCRHGFYKKILSYLRAGKIDERFFSETLPTKGNSRVIMENDEFYRDLFLDGKITIDLLDHLDMRCDVVYFLRCEEYRTLVVRNWRTELNYFSIVDLLYLFKADNLKADGSCKSFDIEAIKASAKKSVVPEILTIPEIDKSLLVEIIKIEDKNAAKHFKKMPLLIELFNTKKISADDFNLKKFHNLNLDKLNTIYKNNLLSNFLQDINFRNSCKNLNLSNNYILQALKNEKVQAAIKRGLYVEFLGRINWNISAYQDPSFIERFQAFGLPEELLLLVDGDNSHACQLLYDDQILIALRINNLSFEALNKLNKQTFSFVKNNPYIYDIFVDGKLPTLLLQELIHLQVKTAITIVQILTRNFQIEDENLYKDSVLICSFKEAVNLLSSLDENGLKAIKHSQKKGFNIAEYYFKKEINAWVLNKIHWSNLIAIKALTITEIRIAINDYRLKLERIYKLDEKSLALLAVNKRLLVFYIDKIVKEIDEEQAQLVASLPEYFDALLRYSEIKFNLRIKKLQLKDFSHCAQQAVAKFTFLHIRQLFIKRIITMEQLNAQSDFQFSLLDNKRVVFSLLAKKFTYIELIEIKAEKSTLLDDETLMGLINKGKIKISLVNYLPLGLTPLVLELIELTSVQELLYQNKLPEKLLLSAKSAAQIRSFQQCPNVQSAMLKGDFDFSLLASEEGSALACCQRLDQALADEQIATSIAQKQIPLSVFKYEFDLQLLQLPAVVSCLQDVTSGLILWERLSYQRIDSINVLAAKDPFLVKLYLTGLLSEEQVNVIKKNPNSLSNVLSPTAFKRIIQHPILAELYNKGYFSVTDLEELNANNEFLSRLLQEKAILPLLERREWTVQHINAIDNLGGYSLICTAQANILQFLSQHLELLRSLAHLTIEGYQLLAEEKHSMFLLQCLLDQILDIPTLNNLSLRSIELLLASKPVYLSFILKKLSVSDLNKLGKLTNIAHIELMLQLFLDKILNLESCGSDILPKFLQLNIEKKFHIHFIGNYLNDPTALPKLNKLLAIIEVGKNPALTKRSILILYLEDKISDNLLKLLNGLQPWQFNKDLAISLLDNEAINSKVADGKIAIDDLFAIEAQGFRALKNIYLQNMYTGGNAKTDFLNMIPDFIVQDDEACKIIADHAYVRQALKSKELDFKALVGFKSTHFNLEIRFQFSFIRLLKEGGLELKTLNYFALILLCDSSAIANYLRSGLINAQDLNGLDTRLDRPQIKLLESSQPLLNSFLKKQISNSHLDLIINFSRNLKNVYVLKLLASTDICQAINHGKLRIQVLFDINEAGYEALQNESIRKLYLNALCGHEKLINAIPKEDSQKLSLDHQLVMNNLSLYDGIRHDFLSAKISLKQLLAIPQDKLALMDEFLKSTSEFISKNTLDALITLIIFINDGNKNKLLNNTWRIKLFERCLAEQKKAGIAGDNANLADNILNLTKDSYPYNILDNSLSSPNTKNRIDIILLINEASFRANICELLDDLALAYIGFIFQRIESVIRKYKRQNKKIEFFNEMKTNLNSITISSDRLIGSMNLMANYVLSSSFFKVSKKPDKLILENLQNETLDILAIFEPNNVHFQGQQLLLNREKATILGITRKLMHFKKISLEIPVLLLLELRREKKANSRGVTRGVTKVEKILALVEANLSSNANLEMFTSLSKTLNIFLNIDSPGHTVKDGSFRRLCAAWHNELRNAETQNQNSPIKALRPYSSKLFARFFDSKEGISLAEDLNEMQLISANNNNNSVS